MDILIKKTFEGRIETKVFRKETHTDRYLNFNSFHHKSQKISVIDSLLYRAFKICSPINLKDEINHITEALTQNSYPLKFINERILRMEAKFKTNHNSSNNIQTTSDIPNSIANINQLAIPNNIQNSISDVLDENEEEKEFWVPLPYIGNVSNKVGGYLRNKLNWKVTFTPGVKIQNLMNTIKDKEEKEPAGVYKIPCNSCDSIYLGESLRINARLNDHKGNVRRREYKKSAVARHIIRNRGHTINWDNSKIIIKESNYHLRCIKEGLAIQQHNGPLMNINKGLVLSRAWAPIIPNILDFT